LSSLDRADPDIRLPAAGLNLPQQAVAAKKRRSTMSNDFERLGADFQLLDVEAKLNRDIRYSSFLLFGIVELRMFTAARTAGASDIRK